MPTYSYCVQPKIELKRLKTTQKNVSTSFRVRAAPESWSKYTTLNFYILLTYIQKPDYLNAGDMSGVYILTVFLAIQMVRKSDHDN